MCGSLIRRAHAIRYPCGAWIFEQGSPVSDAYAICQGGGFIRFAGPEGRSRILRVFAPFDLLGLSEILMEQTAHATSAITARETQAIFISRIDLLDAKARSLSITDALARLAAREALAHQRGLIHALQPGVKERLIETLLQLETFHGRSIPEGHLIDLAITNTDLAEMVGCTVESISHAICELRERKWLLRVQGKFVLCDCQALERLISCSKVYGGDGLR